MSTHLKRSSGYFAKKTGDNFELTFENSSLRQSWCVIKIPMGCRQISAIKLMRVQTPFDFILTKPNGKILFTDTKTTSKDSFPAGLIKDHQLEKLNALARQGYKAGYVINFSKLEKTVFISANQLYFATISRKSIKPDQGLLIGNNKDLNLDLIFQLSNDNEHGANR
jgi:penicillin-binding protein-related factor A (putative recombinase)